MNDSMDEHRRPVAKDDFDINRRLINEANERKRVTVFRITQLNWLVFGVIEAVIGLRVLFKLVAANPENPFANLVYNITDLFLVPFQGLVADPAANGMVLEVTSIIAMLVYALVGAGIAKLIWVLLYHPTE
jgi:uncharacterized protein YggT (Ycf19 family)